MTTENIIEALEICLQPVVEFHQQKIAEADALLADFEKRQEEVRNMKNRIPATAWATIFTGWGNARTLVNAERHKSTRYLAGIREAVTAVQLVLAENPAIRLDLVEVKADALTRPAMQASFQVEDASWKRHLAIEQEKQTAWTASCEAYSKDDAWKEQGYTGAYRGLAVANEEALSDWHAEWKFKEAVWYVATVVSMLTTVEE